MRTLYRNCFLVLAKDESDRALIDDLAARFWAWACDRKRRLPAVRDGFNPPTTAEPASACDLGKDHIVDAVLTTGKRGHQLYGWQFRHPDAVDPAIEWTSELGLREFEPNRIQLSFSVFVRRRDGGFAPVERIPSSPTVIRRIVADHHCSAGLRLAGSAFRISGETEVDDLVRLIREPSRTHPVVFVSRHGSNRALFPVARMAQVLSGLSYVVEAMDPATNEFLSDRISPAHRCFDGAVRLYWPGYADSDPGFRHTLWLCPTILRINEFQDRQFENQVLAKICNIAAFSAPEEFLSWSDVHDAARRVAITEARSYQKEAELLELYEEEVETLRSDKAALESQVRDLEEQLTRERQKSQAYEQALEQRKLGEAKPDIEAELPVKSVAEAIERAEQRHGRRLVFAPNSKSEHAKSPFGEPEEIASAFDWLAKRLVASKLGEVSVPDLDSDLRKRIPGWKYAANQSKQTMGRNSEWYECQWQGRRYTIEQHLKCGTGNDPATNLRIAFAWCPDNQRLVIGYIGQHQKNTRS